MAMAPPKTETPPLRRLRGASRHLLALDLGSEVLGKGILSMNRDIRARLHHALLDRFAGRCPVLLLDTPQAFRTAGDENRVRHQAVR